MLPGAAASFLVELWFSQVRLAVLPSAAASCLVETALLFGLLERVRVYVVVVLLPAHSPGSPLRHL